MSARIPSLGFSAPRSEARARSPRNPPLGVIVSALRGLEGGTLVMRLPDGQTLRLGDGAGPSAAIHVKDAALARRILLNGDVGFAETWVEGLWESPDLFALLKLLAANGDRLLRYLKGGVAGNVIGWFTHAARRNTRHGAQRNIIAHYDLGNDFYRVWLDESLTYSAARFAHDGQSLEAAQAEKYRHLACAADLKPGQHVLEIGCGWGGFAELAATEFGVNVTAVTISDAQYAYTCDRIKRAGLSERVSILRQDYRDIRGTFDGVISIEMLEAVGEKYWPIFFAKLREVMKPGAKAAVQVITVRDDLFSTYRTRADFIQRCVFPGGMLPSIAELRKHTARANLSWLGAESDALAYDRTLRLWGEKFQLQWPEIQRRGFDERFRRFWLFYLAYCAAGFSTGRTSLDRVTLQANCS